MDIKGTTTIAYKKEVNVFFDGTIEDLIRTVEDIEKINIPKKTEKGKGEGDEESWFHYYTMAFEGSALDVFLSKYNNLVNSNMMDNAETECLIAVLNRFFPINALFLQKSYLRRDMKKPYDMPVRTFASRLQTINTYLKYFPPYLNNKIKNEAYSLDQMELLYCFQSALPTHWMQKINESAVNLLSPDMTMEKLVLQCEIYENSDKQIQRMKKKREDQTKAASFKKPKRFIVTPESKWCNIHKSNTHNTSECKSLQQKVIIQKKPEELSKSIPNTEKNIAPFRK